MLSCCQLLGFLTEPINDLERSNIMHPLERFRQLPTARIRAETQNKELTRSPTSCRHFNVFVSAMVIHRCVRVCVGRGGAPGTTSTTEKS